MDSELAEHIQFLVRSRVHGDDIDRIEEILCEDLSDSEESELDEVRRRLREEAANFSEEQKSWPVRTDCDRLDAVFTALGKRGVLAIQNAGYTQSDGHYEVMEIYRNLHENKAIHGYCFYHEQDLERAVHYSQLFLAFGPIAPAQEEIQGPKVGRLIANELTLHGLSVTWDGTFGQRICIEPFDWKKRLPCSIGSAPPAPNLIARVLGLFRPRK